MGFEDRISDHQEILAREAREEQINAEREAQRDIERHIVREKLRENWLKVTAAMFKSRFQPNATVATAEGTARANAVIERKPRVRTRIHSWTGKTYVDYHPGLGAFEEWSSAVLAAIGPVQPAWDMQSFAERTDHINIYRNGPPFRFSRSGIEDDRLYLAQDATIYKRHFIDAYTYAVPLRDYFPISAVLELNDSAADTIEHALAHMVARRALRLENVPPEPSSSRWDLFYPNGNIGRR